MILRCLRQVTEASAPPKSVRTRCRTSTIARTPPSRHTRSSSPALHRTLRASTVTPRASRYSAASCSDAAPRRRRESVDTEARLRGRGPGITANMWRVRGETIRSTRCLQGAGYSTPDLRPVQFAADAVMVIEVQFAGDPGDFAGLGGGLRAKRRQQSIGVETERVQTIAARGAGRPRRANAVANLRGHRIIRDHPGHVGKQTGV